MKILIVLSVLAGSLLFSPNALLFTWIAASPILSNVIEKPLLNPLFGSDRIVNYEEIDKSGYDIVKIFDFDGMVLLLLLLYMFYTQKNKEMFNKIEIPFLALIAALLVSSLNSDSILHGVRTAVETFGFCYISYLIGKNLLSREELFSGYLTSMSLLGVLFIFIGLMEYYVYAVQLGDGYFGHRISGPYRQWESYGLTMAVVFFIFWFKKQLAQEEDRPYGYIATLILFFTMICIVLAQTRTIIIALVAGLLLMHFLCTDINNKKYLSKYALLILGPIILMTVFMFPEIITSNNFFKESAASISERNDTKRLDAYKAAARMFSAHPFTGIGLKNFKDHMDGYISINEISDDTMLGRSNCHNSYLVTAAEAGIIGLIPLLILICIIYVTAWRYYCLAEAWDDKFWALTVIGMSVVFHVTAMTFDSFFQLSQENRLYFLAVGILVGKYQRLCGRADANAGS